MNAIEKLKKAHQLTSIQKKDFSFKDLFTGKKNTAVIEVSAISSKYVGKYDKSNEGGSMGFVTVIYLKDGRITSSFSNALLDFARFFYTASGLDISDTMNYLSFKTDSNPEGHLKIEVSKVDIDSSRSTYNFKIVDGQVQKIETLNKLGFGQDVLMLESGE